MVWDDLTLRYQELTVVFSISVIFLLNITSVSFFANMILVHTIHYMCIIRISCVVLLIGESHNNSSIELTYLTFSVYGCK